MAECSEPDLFLSSTRAGNALTYFVCHYPDSYNRLDYVSVCMGSLCLCGYRRGKKKRFYHGMNFAYGSVYFAMWSGCLGFQRPRRLDSEGMFVNVC